MSLQLDLLAPRWSSRVVLTTSETSLPPYRDPFMAAIAEQLEEAGDRPLQLDRRAWNYSLRGAVGMDVESYRNFFCVCFKRFATGDRIVFERSLRTNFDPNEVREILFSNTIVTFNGLSYDAPILALALEGADPAGLKTATNSIIFGNRRPWEVERELGVRIPKFDHIDLMESNPSVRTGLKGLHARLHGRYIVDLPFDPDALLTPRKMNVTILYCHNDIDGTEMLYRAMREALNLRVALGRKYGQDFRSRSDAQIGEAIVKKRIEDLTGRKIARSGGTSAAPTTFGYSPPDWMAFRSGSLVGLLGELRSAVFALGPTGKIIEPDAVKDRLVPLGKQVYSVGIGGLHSTESHRALVSDGERALIDVDVASQYPNIIRNLGLYPEGLGPIFLDVYGKIVEERLAAKAAGDKITAEGLKIAVNGVYGKLGSEYSIVYAPHLLIAVTLTGQLAILMLIESAERAGIEVVSANTDGVVFWCPKALEDKLGAVLREWETTTGFATEQTRYKALYSSSVNTYIAIKEDGKVKRKGPLADPWSDGDVREQMKKNPQMTVLSDAAVRYLRDGIGIEDTIRSCSDPRMFLTTVKVTAGATWRGQYLGRQVRYYWCLDGDPILANTKSKNKVPRTDGARPLGELTDAMPPQIDYLRYCEEAAKLITDLGVKL